MAKKSSGGNKSSAIRKYKSENPDAGPKIIAEALNKEGLKVTAGFVSTVLSNDKKRSGQGGRRGRRRGRPAASGRGGDVAVAQLIQAKKLADQMGGVEQARQALDALAKLLG